MTAKIYPFFDRPDIGIDVVYYGVPDSNPSSYETAFDYKYSFDPPNYDYAGPTVDPKSFRYYPGSVPGPEFGEQFGTPDMFLNGLSYEKWINGDYPSAPCWPRDAVPVHIYGDSNAVGKSGSRGNSEGTSVAYAIGRSSHKSIMLGQAESSANAYGPGARLSRYGVLGDSYADGHQRSGFVGRFNITGVASGLGAGRSTASSVAYAPGTSSASAYGSETDRAKFNSVADSSANGIGAAEFEALFSLIADASANGQGLTAKLSTYGASAVASASGVGSANETATYGAIGDSSANAVAVTGRRSTFAASAVASASGVGVRARTGTFTASGVATGSGVGRTARLSTYAASAVASASGVGSSSSSVTAAGVCGSAPSISLGITYAVTGSNPTGGWLQYPSVASGTYHMTTSAWSHVSTIGIRQGASCIGSLVTSQSSAGCTTFTLGSTATIFLQFTPLSTPFTLTLLLASGAC